jgi:pimeloyl-ACP methyl ester carboxylesterase
VLVLVALLIAASPSTRLAARTLLLLPSFFAELPGAPLDLIGGAPARETVELPPVDGFVRAHVYHPASGRHPALVISLGIDPAPPDDPRVVRLLDGIARSGVVAVLVESEALDNDRLYPDLSQVLVEGVQFALDSPHVRSDRVGLFGFSVGGSIALVAAARPEIADRLRLVDAFGSYATLEDALLSVASGTIVVDGVEKPWQPANEARAHLANALLTGLTDQAEVDALRSYFVKGDRSAPLDPAALSPEARAVYELMTVKGRGEGEELLAGLPALAREDFAALSPLPVIARLRAPLFVMYDRDDPLLPFTGSLALCVAARAADSQPYCSGFAIFQHVDPTRGGNPVVVAHDLSELYLHVFALLRRLQ